MAGSTTVLQPGATKSHPYTICIVANPVLEVPWQSGVFVADPIMGNAAAFTASVTYVHGALFGLLPGHTERWLADPGIAPHIRVISLWSTALPLVSSNALVAQDGASNMLIARREVFVAFLEAHQLEADVVYAISGSSTHTRASAWFTTDDDSLGGVPFVIDGAQMTHRHWNKIPGTIAMHLASRSLIALHEFQHAASSYTNGQIVDLYVDSAPGVNCKRRRPIPVTFATYIGTNHRSDQTRDGLSYPASWASFHCALHDPSHPAVMDDFWQSAPPEVCQNDTITRQFLADRIRAKLAR